MSIDLASYVLGIASVVAGVGALALVVMVSAEMVNLWKRRVGK